MARIVVLGAGISGHTAALHLRRKLGREHEVVVVSPNSKWNWIPSNIWVGVGRMTAEQVTFPIAPIYKRKGIGFRQALAKVLFPEGDAATGSAFVEIEYTDPAKQGQRERLEYDFLINATGPKLNFGATPGLGPEGNTYSVCTAGHAVEASKKFQEVLRKLKGGERQTIVIGMGHGTCTCQGAAFEYTFNVEHELREAGVRDKADLFYLTNESQLGDFGMDGMVFRMGGRTVTSGEWMESLFSERGVRAIMESAVEKVEPGRITYERLDGSKHELAFDFAMLLPPFGGVGLTAFDSMGNDITSELFAPSGFMKVDADYSPKAYEDFAASDWPSTYQTPRFGNVFAAGIAFAPPHQLSRPNRTPNGTMIAPAPPRTGMPSGVIGRAVAMSIVDMITKGATVPTHPASMAHMGAACVASAGTGLLKGEAAAMTVYPIVPDKQKYPEGGGRSLADTFGDLGLSAHWMKFMLHYLFIYKAKARPLWFLIPE